MFCRRITTEEVQEVIRKMRRGQAIGPDVIPIEVWRCFGKEGISWLTRLFNVILKTAKIPKEWRFGTLIPLYKNKGDIQSCNNYRGIKLLSHTMKIWERMVEKRMRRDGDIFDNQFGFMLRNYRERKRDLPMVFIDLEKVNDRVPREVLWKCLEKKEVPV